MDINDKELENELNLADKEIEKDQVTIELGDAQEPGTREPGNQEQPANSPEMIMSSLTVALSMVTPLYPSLKDVYTDQVIKQIATTACNLANKHNFSVLGFLTKWQEEIAFAAIMVPTAINTYKAIDKDMKTRQQKNQEQDDQAPTDQEQEKPDIDVDQPASIF